MAPLPTDDTQGIYRTSRDAKQPAKYRRAWLYWPGHDGLIVIPLSLPALLRRVRRGRLRVGLNSPASKLANLNASQIADLYNRAADAFVVPWIHARIREAEFQAVSVDVLQLELQFNLGMSEECARRVLIKHTSAAGAFVSLDGMLTERI